MPPELSPWLQYGVLGLVMAAILAGLLVTKGHADEIRAQRKEALDGWREQTAATKEATMAVRELSGVVIELRTQIAELLRREATGRRGS